MEKYFILIILAILFFSCKSNSNIPPLEKQDKIPYILPINVEKVMIDYIKDNTAKDFSFEIRKVNKNFTIYASSSDTYWKKNTNRYLVIRNKLYPLFFDYDFLFGSAESAKKVLKKLKNNSEKIEFTRKVVYNIYDHVFKVEFNSKGDIIYMGFE